MEFKERHKSLSRTYPPPLLERRVGLKMVGFKEINLSYKKRASLLKVVGD
jgi:hypothetical protein